MQRRVDPLLDRLSLVCPMVEMLSRPEESGIQESSDWEIHTRMSSPKERKRDPSTELWDITYVVNLEDRRVSTKPEGNSEGVEPRGECFRREQLCQMLLRGQVRSVPKLALDLATWRSLVSWAREISVVRWK